MQNKLRFIINKIGFEMPKPAMLEAELKFIQINIRHYTPAMI